MSSRRASARGVTLVENMMAIAVLAAASTGAVSMSNQSIRAGGEARRITRATEIAQDLVTQVQLWAWDDARLANSNPANDRDIGNSSAFDHDEEDITVHGTDPNILAREIADFNGLRRFLNVSYVDNDGTLLDANNNGTPDAVRVAVIVQWAASGGTHEVVLLTTKVNPGDAL